MKKRRATSHRTRAGAEHAGPSTTGRSLQRRTAGSSSSESTLAVPRTVHDVLQSPGQPLDKATRAYFEPRFAHDFSQVPVHSSSPAAGRLPSELGVSRPENEHERTAEQSAERIVSAAAPPPHPGMDFSGVRIHNDANAADSANAVNAAAYTVGNNIVFSAGRYEPGTTNGRRLLAHELTHVVQQNAGTPPVLARVNLTALDFSAMAEALHNAMARFGTDEELIFVTLQKLERDAAATRTLRTTYQTNHGTDLERDIRSEMSGSELDLALELLGVNPSGGPVIQQAAPRTPAEFEAAARRIEAATVGQIGTDEEAVYATLLPLNRQAAASAQLKTTYQTLIGRALEDDLNSEMSGDELAYALYLLNAPPPAAPRGTFQTLPGGTAPATAPPPVEGGQVSALTGVPYPTSSGGQRSISFAVSYSGGMAADSRWLQFIWREIQVTDSTGATRMLGDQVTVGARTYPLTTNARQPNYSVDSRSPTDPFYEASTSTARREPDLTMIADAPTPIRSLVAREYGAGARSVISRAHFEIYLIRDYRTLYHVGIDVEHAFSDATNYSTSRSIRVTETVSELPTRLHSALVRDYPAFDFIQ